MKKSSKNETQIADLINKLQEQLLALDKKVDILVQRSLPETKPVPKPLVNNAPSPTKQHDRHHGREQHKAICADCKKECTIPFKPSGDRPVYCKDCFSRRKVISLSGIKIENKPQVLTPLQTPALKENTTPKTIVKTKKKTVPVKKTVTKKKIAPKKK